MVTWLHGYAKRVKSLFLFSSHVAMEPYSPLCYGAMFSLILPTYNEAENLPELIPKIEDVLRGIPHEIIVVDDDSPDQTWTVAHTLSQKFPALHVVRRIGRRGLSSAVVEGFLSANGDILAVADADGQHDLSLLKNLYRAVAGK